MNRVPEIIKVVLPDGEIWLAVIEKVTNGIPTYQTMERMPNLEPELQAKMDAQLASAVDMVKQSMGL